MWRVAVKGGTRPPWVGLGAAVWVQIAAGNAYNFPLYSHSLKSVLGFNQQQISMLGVANDVGENIGIVAGLACNMLPPWVVLLVGAVGCFFGYGVLWLALTRTLLHLPYWLLWIALCIATNSSAWFTTAVLVTNMRNFPLNRGTVAGILKGYGGLSAAVFTQVYSILLHSSSTRLLLFLALGIPVLCFITMFLVRPCTPASVEASAEQSHFTFIQITSIALGLYILVITILNNTLSFSDTILYCSIAVMIVLIMTPLAIPVKMTLFHKNVDDKLEPLLEDENENENENDGGSVISVLLAEGEGAVKKKRRPKRGEDFKFVEAVVKADFWLLFLVFFFGVGSGVTVLNNLAQIGIAQGVGDTTMLLCLFSFFNFLGRLGGGVVSEHFVRTRTIPRTVWMTITQLIMVFTYLLFASDVKGTLYPATGSLGLCFGVQFSIMIPTTSELFGLKHFGTLYNIMAMGNPFGAFLFSGLLAGYVYDVEEAKQRAHGASCLGPDCFRLTFLVLAGVCGAGTLLSAVLSVRIRPVYRMLYAGGSFRLPESSDR